MSVCVVAARSQRNTLNMKPRGTPMAHLQHILRVCVYVVVAYSQGNTLNMEPRGTPMAHLQHIFRVCVCMCK